jgi:DNA-binding FrmR family transcriptional regulator
MAHTIREQARLLARVRRLKGQVEAVERALANEHECAEVLQQLAAIRGAANGLMAAVLEEHAREHLKLDRDREPEVFLQVIRRYVR